MSERKVVHEVKLQKSVVIILGVIAAGVFFNAFGSAVGMKSALADISSGDAIRLEVSGYLNTN